MKWQTSERERERFENKLVIVSFFVLKKRKKRVFAVILSMKKYPTVVVMPTRGGILCCNFSGKTKILSLTHSVTILRMIKHKTR